jgi:hypothetical protein
MSAPSPPDQPRDTLELLPPQRPRSTLAKLVIMFAVTMGVTFGLCTLSAATMDMANLPEWFGEYIYPISAAIEAICLLGMLTIAVITIVRAIKAHFTY